MQSEHAFVKWPRLVGVEGGGESHDFVRGEHAILPVDAKLSIGVECNCGGQTSKKRGARPYQSAGDAARHRECDLPMATALNPSVAFAPAIVLRMRGAQLVQMGNCR